MGWSWALYFCQAALSDAVAESLANPQDPQDPSNIAESCDQLLQANPQDCEGPPPPGLLVDGWPAPQLAKGSPVAAVYVDNAALIATLKVETQQCLDRLQLALQKRGLAYHQLIEPCKCLEFVGLDVDVGRRRLCHKDKRAWRLYKALRALLHIGGCLCENMRSIVGHLNNYFTLCRPGMIVLRHVYTFIQSSIDKGFVKF